MFEKQRRGADHRLVLRVLGHAVGLTLTFLTTSIVVLWVQS